MFKNTTKINWKNVKIGLSLSFVLTVFVALAINCKGLYPKKRSTVAYVSNKPLKPHYGLGMQFEIDSIQEELRVVSFMILEMERNKVGGRGCDSLKLVRDKYSFQMDSIRKLIDGL